MPRTANKAIKMKASGMNLTPKKKAKCRSKEATRKRYDRRFQKWMSTQQTLAFFWEGLKNPKGKCRTMAENRFLILAVIASLKRRLVSTDIKDIMTIN